ncbi:MAG TPA: hypothetical protein VF469_39285 [Kofleriaceae bacterium]
MKLAIVLRYADHLADKCAGGSLGSSPVADSSVDDICGSSLG